MHGGWQMAQGKISMKGGGYYSANTVGAKHVIDRAGKLLVERLASVDVAPKRRAFCIADYGAADGGTSLELIGEIIAAVRSEAPEQQISVVYTDLPHNDFSALFRLLHGQDPELSSYLNDHSDVFVASSGTTFYRQIVADDSVDVGFSATAMHWLSGVPGAIDDHVHAVGATGAQWESFREHALADWETILLHRARELAPGGLLVMANFCIDEQGRHLGNTEGANMFDTFRDLWRELAETGVITHEEFKATVFPQFYKTIDQFRAPFDDPDGPVTQAGLRLESIFTSVTECPYRAEFDRQGDAAAFADAYIPTLRSWSENVFYSGLDESRPAEERRRIIERFYGNYNAMVRSEPQRHAMDYVHVYMVVRKI